MTGGTDQTYRIRQNGTVRGFCTGMDAVKQSIWKILNTWQGEHLIYGNSGYGVDWEGVRAALDSDRESEAQKILTTALTMDERVRRVEEITFSRQLDGIAVSMRVTCVCGSFWVQEEMEHV